jgi:sugar lactone lactonase YvrE
MTGALDGFTLKRSDFSIFGSGLHRPECVWIDYDGIWVSDARGGVSRLDAEGRPRLIGSGIEEPNGFTRRADGTLVVAGLGSRKVFEIRPDGTTTVLLDQIDGKPLGPVNFAFVDRQDRVWVAIMNRGQHWYDSMATGRSDGHIILIDKHGARIVADGLNLTNEVKVSPDGKHLYIVETFGRRIVRHALDASGALGPREVFGPADLGHGAYPDGFAFDAEGNVWIATVSRNAIQVITHDGRLLTVYEEPNLPVLAKFVDDLAARRAEPAQLAACASEFLGLPTSIAFGGSDGKTVYVGSLLLPHLITFRSPVAGAL